MEEIRVVERTRRGRCDSRLHVEEKLHARLTVDFDDLPDAGVVLLDDEFTITGERHRVQSRPTQGSIRDLDPRRDLEHHSPVQDRCRHRVVGSENRREERSQEHGGRNDAESDPTLCPDKQCTPEGREVIDAGETKGTVSTAMLIVGGAAAAAGIIMLAVSGSSSEAEAEQSHLQILPMISSQGAGLVITGTL